MPELPDILVYREALARRVVGRKLDSIQVLSPFLLRTVEPPITGALGRRATNVERIGKRIVLGFEGDLFLVFHLMIAGRFRWLAPTAKSAGKISLARFGFDSGVLLLTEAGSKRRASLHVVAGRTGLAGFDRGGLDVLTATEATFFAALTRENHTLKRALTDPTILDGIGNAYSDEILHRARLSPVLLTSRMVPEQLRTLYHSTSEVLREWIERLRVETGDGWPEKVTAFRPDMAVHGRFGMPCPVCSTPVQRIRYADNETNYCPTCQTGGKLLADRGLSRLLKGDWPRTLEELEERKNSPR